MLLKESTVQSKEQREAAAIRVQNEREDGWGLLKTIYRVPSQLCKVWSRMFVILGLWKDDALQEMWDEIHSGSGQTLVSAGTPDLYEHWTLSNKTTTKKGRSLQLFNAPVNGLESSALLLQFNTVLIYFIFIYIYIFILYIYLYIFNYSLCMIKKTKITREADDDRWVLKTDFVCLFFLFCFLSFMYRLFEFINKALEPFFLSFLS